MDEQSTLCFQSVQPESEASKNYIKICDFESETQHLQPQAGTDASARQDKNYWALNSKYSAMNQHNKLSTMAPDHKKCSNNKQEEPASNQSSFPDPTQYHSKPQAQPHTQPHTQPHPQSQAQSQQRPPWSTNLQQSPLQGIPQNYQSDRLQYLLNEKNSILYSEGKFNSNPSLYDSKEYIILRKEDFDKLLLKNETYQELLIQQQLKIKALEKRGVTQSQQQQPQPYTSLLTNAYSSQQTASREVQPFNDNNITIY